MTRKLEGVILRVQEIGHKEDESSKLSGEEEGVIKHSRQSLSIGYWVCKMIKMSLKKVVDCFQC